MKIVIISLVTLLCALATQSLKIKDASDSGKDFKISTHLVLEGKLKNMKGQFVNSQTDISIYVSNQNGVLTMGRGGGFNQTCKDCKVDEKLNLSCSCQDAKGAWKASSLKLGAKIENMNGFFKVKF